MKAIAKVNKDGNEIDGYHTEVIVRFENGVQPVVFSNPSFQFENAEYEVTFSKIETPEPINEPDTEPKKKK